MWPSKLQLAILDTLFEVTFSETVVGATFLARLFSIPRSEGGMRVPHQHGLVQHLVRGVGAELHDLLVRDPHQAVPLPLRLHRCKTVRCSEHFAASFFLLRCCLLRRSLVSALLGESLCLVYSTELFRLTNRREIPPRWRRDHSDDVSSRRAPRNPKQVVGPTTRDQEKLRCT